MARRRRSAGRGAWIVHRAPGSRGSSRRTPVAVIPLPAEIAPGEGAFRSRPRTVVRVPRDDTEAQNAAQYLVELARTLTRTEARGSARRMARVTGDLLRTAAGHGAEGVCVSRSLPAACGSARPPAPVSFMVPSRCAQLLPRRQGRRAGAGQTIRDAPAYAWRGLMLDSARHFQSPAVREVDDRLDGAAQAQRPALASHGRPGLAHRNPQVSAAHRGRRVARTGHGRRGRKAPRYGGYYTQAEMRDIVKLRGVATHPDRSRRSRCRAMRRRPSPPIRRSARSTAGPAPPVSAKWGVHTYLFNLEPSTFTFLEDVLDGSDGAVSRVRTSMSAATKPSRISGRHSPACRRARARSASRTRRRCRRGSRRKSADFSCATAGVWWVGTKSCGPACRPMRS